MRANPKCVVLGCQCDEIDEKDLVIGQRTFPLSDTAIRWRMADSEADRVLRAKTGSLETVSALAGIVQGERNGHGRVFAIFMNGELRGRIRRMWKYQDAFAKVVAEGP